MYACTIDPKDLSVVNARCLTSQNGIRERKVKDWITYGVLAPGILHMERRSMGMSIIGYA